VARGSVSTVRSRSTAVRGSRPIKTPRPAQPRNPSSFPPFSFPRHLFLPSPRSKRERESGDRRRGASGATASPLAGARVHRKVSAPPSSGITVVPLSGARERHGGGSRGIGSRRWRPERIDGRWRKKEVSPPIAGVPFPLFARVMVRVSVGFCLGFFRGFLWVLSKGFFSVGVFQILINTSR
jgi:hypothetical protein